MKVYKFSKVGIEKMYKDTYNECFKALDDGKINDVKFQVQMGNQVITIPTNADFMEIIFAALKECEEEDF